MLPYLQVESTPDLDSVLTARIFFRETNSRELDIFFRGSQTNSREIFFREGRFRNLATFFGDISDSALKCEYLEL